MTEKVSSIEALPHDLQSWWQAFKAVHSYTLVRDQRAMQWLFFTGSFPESRKVLEVRKDSTLLGFVSLKLVELPAYAVVEVADMALIDASEPVLQASVSELAKAAGLWRKNVAYVRTNSFNDTMRKALLRAGFWKTEGRARYYYLDPSGNLAADHLYATPIDGDRALFP